MINKEMADKIKKALVQKDSADEKGKKLLQHSMIMKL